MCDPSPEGWYLYNSEVKGIVYTFISLQSAVSKSTHPPPLASEFWLLASENELFPS